MSGNPLVVVIGQIGSGKTTLVNKLCNSKLPTEAGGKSATQSIWSVGSAYGNGFDVYDTPGFGTDENKVQHAAAIVGALTNEKVTRILVVVKFERNALMKASLEVSLNPVKRYFELVTIVVTHWDMSNNNDRDTRELTDDILPKFGIKSYLLSGKMITGESLCRQIDVFLTPTTPTLIDINRTEFSGGFDLLEENQNYSKKIKEDFTKFRDLFQKLASKVRCAIEQIDEKNPDLDEILHAITIWIKKEAENLIQNFEKSHSTTMNQLYIITNDAMFSYLYQIELKKLIQKELQNCIDMAQKKMIIKPDHPFNRIKQCPYCHLIWLKVAGCDGETNCGEYPSKQEEKEEEEEKNGQNPGFYKNFTRVEIEETPEDIIYTVKKAAQTFGTLQEQEKTKLKGCGRTIIWSELPPLDIYLTKKLMDAGLLDFLCDKRQESAELISKYNETTQDAIRMAQNQIQRFEQEDDSDLIAEFPRINNSIQHEIDDNLTDNKTNRTVIEINVHQRMNDYRLRIHHHI